MLSRSASESGRASLAGIPSASMPAVTRIPGGTTAPAPTMAPDSTTAPSSTRAPMPIRQPGSSVQPWIMQECPMATSAPMTSGWVSWVTCNTVPSWTFERAPIRIQFTSPRAAVWNQKETSSPTSIAPVRCAPGARNTRSPRLGRVPR